MNEQNITTVPYIRDDPVSCAKLWAGNRVTFDLIVIGGIRNLSAALVSHSGADGHFPNNVRASIATDLLAIQDGGQERAERRLPATGLNTAHKIIFDIDLN